jgi:hypothetical protein
LQIILQYSLNSTLVDRYFMRETRGDSYICDNGSPFNSLSINIFVFIRLWSFLGIPERDLPHLAPFGQDLLRQAQALENLKGTRLQAIGLAGFQRSGFGVDAEKGGVCQAVSSEEDFEEEACWPCLVED